MRLNEAELQERRAKIVDMYVNQRLGMSQIHKATGVSKSRIAYALRDAGVTMDTAQRKADYDLALTINKEWREREEREEKARYIAWLKAHRPKHQRTNWYASNHERHLASARAYYQANKAKINANPVLRIRRNIRCRLWKILHGYKGKTALIGCSPQQLRLWLESKMKQPMTWHNYGTVWEVDHKRPLASFDLTDKQQLAEACHYTNLQPLLKHENRAKAAYWAPEYNGNN